MTSGGQTAIGTTRPFGGVVTGVRAILSIGNLPIIFASNVSYTITHNMTPIEVLDRLTPAEWAETGYQVEFTFNSFRVVGKSATALGFEALPTDALLRQPEFTVELQAAAPDNTDPKTILRIYRAKMRGRRGTVDARGVMTETIDFVGILADDEGGYAQEQPLPA